MMIRIRSITTAAFAGALLLTSTAWAVDGVILIDQNRALAGNVTPGDTPGFPVTISQPGSYRLSGNLSVPDEVDGIKITADNVTLDLNGFAIAGAGTDANTGISVSSQNDVAILNGVITRMNVGILFDAISNGRVDKIRANGNAIVGISLHGNGTVENCTASKNGIGIVIERMSNGVSGSSVRDNDATNNRLWGIQVTCPGVNLIGNTVLGNNADLNFFGFGSEGCRIGPDNLFGSQQR